MKPTQVKELNLLKANAPTIEEVYTAIDEKNVDVIWRYFWPVTLSKAFEFFSDDEDARNATLDHMERWLVQIFQYDGDRAKISPFFDAALQSNFVDWLRVNKEDMPQIDYGWTEEEPDEEDEEEVPLARCLIDTQHEEIYGYPYTGRDDNTPLSTLLQKEEEENRQFRVEELFNLLTHSEKDVFELLLQGKTSHEIATILGKTPHNINEFLSQIRQKVDTMNEG